MDEVISVGFKSPTLSFTRDMTVGELISVIAEHVHSFEEASNAANMLAQVWSSGRYDGTGWNVWFVRKDRTGTIH